MLATEYAQQFNLQPQRENESDTAFKNRVAEKLRDMGAVAQAMQGVDYGGSGSQKIGDDIAAGYVVQKPKEDPLMLLLAMALFGGERK